jgi:hypothetical protein
MDILGFDKQTIDSRPWRNAAEDDLREIDKEISDLTKQKAQLSKDNLVATQNVTKCSTEKEGLFKVYNCKRHTGKTLADWERIATTGSSQIADIEARLRTLNSQRAAAVKRIKDQAMAAGASAEAAEQVAEQRSAESKASAEKGKSIGIWVAVGLGAVAIGALIFTKIIKKK